MASTVAKIRIGEQGSTTDWWTIAEKRSQRAGEGPGGPRRLRAADVVRPVGLLAWAGRAGLPRVHGVEPREAQPVIALHRAAASVGVTGLAVTRPGFWRGLMTRSGQG